MMHSFQRAGLLVVVSTQRSGSNWLEDRLRSHSEIAFLPHEPFRRTLVAPGSFEEYRLRRPPLARSVPAMARHTYLSAALAGASTTWLGLRVMYDQLRRSALLSANLATWRPVVVHLVRHNVLATHVSAATARETGQFITTERVGDGSRVSVTLPTADLVRALDRRQRLIVRHRQVLRALPLSVLEIGYEKAIADPPSTDRALLEHLGLAGTVLATGLERMSIGTVADRLVNANEVRRALDRTRYKGLVDRP